MAITPDALWGPGSLTAAAAAIYTSPAATTTVVKRAVFLNTDTTTRTITVHVVRSGGSATTGNKVINAFALYPNQAYVAVELTNLVLEAGDAIYALASSASVVNSIGSGFSQ